MSVLDLVSLYGLCAGNLTTFGPWHTTQVLRPSFRYQKRVI